jgi:hypothetical protein
MIEKSSTNGKIKELTEFFKPKKVIFYLDWDEETEEVVQLVLQNDQNSSTKIIGRFKI